MGASEELRVIITGVDNATAQFRKISNEFTKTGDAMIATGRRLTTSLTLPIIALGGVAVKAASDMSESMAKVETVFGSASDEIMKFAEGSATGMGIAKQKTMEMTATFGSMFDTMGFGTEETAKMSKQMTGLVADYAAFHNLSPDEAFIKLRSAMAGSAEVLYPLGKDIKQNTVNQKALAMGLASTTKELTTQDLALARYTLIVEQSQKEIGAFERESGNMASQLRIAKAQFQDAATALGQHLLPIATKAITALNGMLESFNKLGPGSQKAIVMVAGALALIGPATTLVGGIVKTIGIIKGFSALTAAGGAIPAAAAGLKGLGTSAAAAAPGIWATVAPLAALAGAIALLAVTWEKYGGQAMDTLGMIGGIGKIKFQQMTGKLPKYATGGYLPEGQLGIVGEKGPELIAGGRGGSTIYPNASSQTVVVNLNYNPTVSLADRAEAEQKLVPFIEAALRRKGLSYG